MAPARASRISGKARDEEARNMLLALAPNPSDSGELPSIKP